MGKKIVTILLTIGFIALPFAFSYGENDPREHLEKGIEYERRGIQAAALKEYELAIVIDPNYNDALFNAGLIYVRGKQWSKAIDTLERVTRLNPNDGAAHYHLAVAYFGLGKYHDAIKSNDRSVKLGYMVQVPLRSLLELYRYKEIDFEYTPTLTSQREKVIIKINGNPMGTETLIRDTLSSLEIQENVSKKGIFKGVNVEFIKREDDTNGWVEKWTVLSSSGSQNQYMVIFVPSRQGGTDIQVREIKEGADQTVIIDMR